ncbi:MAG: hypothetical protein AAF481_10810 [Acidobacteriota bacterium]
MPRTLRPFALFAALSLLIALPAGAYTIYLKDGSKIEAREAYEVIDGTAYFTYINGTRTFIDASEIDAERTRIANEQNLGTALVLEGGKVRELKKDELGQTERKPTLADLINRRRDQPDRPARGSAGPGAADRGSITEGGYRDLANAARQGFSNAERDAKVLELFRSQGLATTQTYQGSNPSSILVTVETAGEPQVFRALVVAASALRSAARDGDLETLELLMNTPTGERAGQFVLTPEMADDLLDQRVDPPLFFQAHVQF